MKHSLLRLQYVLCFEMEGTRFYGKHAAKEEKEYFKFAEQNGIKKNHTQETLDYTPEDFHENLPITLI